MIIAIGTALWLGILTSISPCPLATNIAAITFISKSLESTKRVLLSGLAYTIGRMIAYLAVGIIIVSGLLSVPALVELLEQYLNKFLGFILIVVGMFLLGLISIRTKGAEVSEGLKAKAEKGGILGAGLLGIIFGLSFCPISAIIFFASLIPLAVKYGSKFLLPSIYGIGTALPVVVFALIVAFSAGSIGRAFNSIKAFEKWARIVTGVVFILVGIYYILAYIYGINILDTRR